jgi:Uma2 family endonuclease
MKSMILDPNLTRELIRNRRRLGHDRQDEVWDGVYVVSPNPDNLHQRLALRIARAFEDAIGGETAGVVYPSVNVSDRQTNWRKNFRVPDVAVFLAGNPAQDRDTHWVGGPDFAVEIISRHDRSRRKFAFYAKVGVRELLLVDRKPWALELYRLRDGVLAPAGRVLPESSAELKSEVLPVSFCLLPGTPRPRIEVTRSGGSQTWLI